LYILVPCVSYQESHPYATKTTLTSPEEIHTLS